MLRLLAISLVFCASIGCAIQGDNPKPQIPNLQQHQAPKSETIAPDLEAKIQALVKQLGDNDLTVRQSATRELILVGRPAEPHVKEALSINDADINHRTNAILKAIPIRERRNFSDRLLKWYPDIYEELGSYDNDHQKQFTVLQKLTELDFERRPLHYVMESDMAALIGELLFDEGKGLCSRQKDAILDVISGNNHSDIVADRISDETFKNDESPYPITIVWHREIPSAVPHVRKLLHDGSGCIRVMTILALEKLKAKEAIPDIKKLLKDNVQCMSGFGPVYVKITAAEAIANLDDKEAIPAYKDLLKDDDEDIRDSACSSLRLLGLSDEEIKELKEEKAK